MTQISFIQRAPKGHIFEPGCFDHDLGNRVPFNAGKVTVMATLISAQVLPSGEGVEITVDVPDWLIAPMLGVSA